MMHLRAVAYVSSLGLLLVGACGKASAPTEMAYCAADHICVTGTVRSFTSAGGFWAVRGDDGVTYDPLQSLPPEFRVEGLRVDMVAYERPDAYNFHEADLVVSIVAIRRIR